MGKRLLPNEGDVTKLPKWAQDRIMIAERDLAHFKEQHRKADAGETDVFIDDFAARDFTKRLIGLPPGTHIVFEVPGPDGTFSVHAFIREKDGLELYTTNGHILVKPNAANSLHVFGSRR